MSITGYIWIYVLIIIIELAILIYLIILLTIIASSLDKIYCEFSEFNKNYIIAHSVKNKRRDSRVSIQQRAYNKEVPRPIGLSFRESLRDFIRGLPTNGLFWIFLLVLGAVLIMIFLFYKLG